MPNWIKNAIGRKGALHEMLGIPKGRKIPQKTLVSAAKKPGLLGKRARLAITLSHFRH